jgi:hypothetical protein
MTAEEFLAYLRQAILQANTNDLDTTLQIVADVQNSITEFNS